MSIRERLRTDLRAALGERDGLAVSTIRTLIAAIENAEAVDVETTTQPKPGLDNDVPRRVLQSEDVARVVAAEHHELADAVARYRELGLTEETAELETRLRIVERYLD